MTRTGVNPLPCMVTATSRQARQRVLLEDQGTKTGDASPHGGEKVPRFSARARFKAEHRSSEPITTPSCRAPTVGRGGAFLGEGTAPVVEGKGDG